MQKTYRTLLAGSCVAAVASSTFLISVFAAPACNGSTFDSFTLGSVNGQGGWQVTGGYDQAVVDNEYGYAFGCKSLRLSNAVTSGSFGDQTFSPSNANEAGETSATANGFSGGTRQTHFEAQFDIGTTVATEQPGLFVSVSPDRGDGSRMSYLGFGDTPAGINVTFYDVQGTTNPATFVPTVVATGLSRATSHTAKIAMDFVDGPSNDVVKIYIDGNLVHTGTSWENYYRYDSEASAEQTPRTTDSLLFRAGGTAAPGTSGNGFVFDNFSMSSATLPAAPLFWVEEDTTQVKVDWKAVPGATSYNVYRSPDNVTFAPVFSGPGLTYTDTVSANTHYWYRVTSVNGDGEAGLGAPALYAGTKTVVIDDGAMASDFNASGTAVPSSGWGSYDVNTSGAEQILAYTVGGDNYSIPGAYGAQTFDWTTAGALSGNYNVYVAYICDSSRGTASYNVYSGASQLNGAPLAVNQGLKSSDGSPCGSQTDAASQPYWKLLGTYSFSGNGRVQLASATGNYIVADAVAFTPVVSSSSSSAATSSSVSSMSSSTSSVGSCPVTGLVGYWKFDEGTGTSTADSSGNGHTGTLENGPAWSTDVPSIGGPNPYSLSFDGTDDQVRVAGSSSLQFGTGSFTASLWSKTTSGDRSVMGDFTTAGPGNRGYGLYYYSSNQVNYFGYGDGGSNDASKPGAVLNGAWHQVTGVFTRSAGNVTIDTYVDGVLAGSNTAAVGNITSNSDLLFGKYLAQPAFNGLLDDIRIYDRALAAGEVSTLATGCAGGSSSSSSSVSSSTSSAASSSSSVASSSSSSVAAVPTCNGMTATIYVNGANKIVGGPQNGQNFTGTLNGASGNDVIVGTNNADMINGNGGNDTICGMSGPDMIDGGAGNDFIAGQADNDLINAKDGNDIVCGGSGNDLLQGGTGNDKMDGGAAGNDMVSGQSGNDQCRNGESNPACEQISAVALPECAGF